MPSENHTAVLGYYDEQLYDFTDDIMQNLVAQMMNQTNASGNSNARWVLVGHSQGGIVVRLLHEYIRENRPNIEVEGVMAVASPMQGARAARMAYGDVSGNYYDVRPEMNNFLVKVLGPSIADSFEDTVLRVGYRPYGGSSFVEIASNFYDVYGVLADAAIDRAAPLFLRENINAISYDKGGASAIGPNGNLIQEINSAPNPARYRALIGAERFPVPFRVWSGSYLDQGKNGTPWLPLIGLGGSLVANDQGFPSLGVLFEAIGNVPAVNPGDEPTTVNYYNNVHALYENTENFYDSQQGPPFYFECWDGDGTNPCIREDRWNKGENAIENFPDTYAQVISAYKLARRYGTRTVCPDTRNNGGGQRVADGRFVPPTAQEYVDYYLEPPDADGDPNDRDDPNECWEEGYYYYVSIPDKSDGIVSVETGKWSEHDSPDDRAHNFLYEDNGSGLGDGTGYNHAEMVYNRRRFNSSDDPLQYETSFQQGEANPPMVNAEDWIEDVFGLQ